MKIAKLSEVCDFQGGSQPPKSEFIFEPKEGYIRLLQIRDFSRDDKAAYIPLDKARRFCLDDDIMIGRYGASVGQIHKGKSGSYNVALIKTLPDLTKLNRDYFYYYLTSPNFQKPLLNAAERSAQAGFSKKDIADFEVPVPSLVEQKRIVGVLNVAFSKIDRLETIAKCTIENAEDMFQAAMEKVYAQCPNSWLEDKLHNLATKIGSGATPRGGQKSYKQTGLSLIRSLNVHDNRFKYAKLALIDDEQAEKLSNVTLQSGDVLLNITGASVARCCVVPNDVLPARVNQHVSIIRPKIDMLDSKFLCFALISQTYKNQLLGIGEEGGSTRQAITKAQIQEFEIRFPQEIKEQKRLVKVLENAERLSTAVISNQKNKLIALSELRQSLLQKAFAAELVSMNENEVPSQIISIPINDNYTHHAGAIAYADSYFRNNAPDTFHGRTIFEKVVQAAEAIAGIELGRQAVQGMRGPTDDKQRDIVEAMASEKGYFSFESTGGKGMKLKRGRNFSKLRLSFEENFQAQIPALDKFLRLIAPMPTRDVEVLSTVHTAWNNYLIEKQEPTNEQIVYAAREGWHEEKTKIPRHKFFTAIESLRERDLIPTGQGKYVGKIAGQSFDF